MNVLHSLLVLITVFEILIFSACSTQTKELPTTKPPPYATETIPGVNATPEIAPPANAIIPTPTPELKLQEYQGEVKKSWTEGSMTFDGIVSNLPCKTSNDCTSIKYINAPKNDDECKCAAPCTPYVVNQAEKQRREAANKKFCDNEDWYGRLCPAPECGFVEFEKFKCYKGKCAGLAMGKN